MEPQGVELISETLYNQHFHKSKKAKAPEFSTFKLCQNVSIFWINNSETFITKIQNFIHISYLVNNFLWKFDFKVNRVS